MLLIKCTLIIDFRQTEIIFIKTQPFKNFCFEERIGLDVFS